MPSEIDIRTEVWRDKIGEILQKVEQNQTQRGGHKRE
jgi:hypothetical protein